MAGIQSSSGGYLISATAKKGEYDGDDFSLEFATNAFFVALPFLIQGVVSGVKGALGLLRRAGSPRAGAGGSWPTINEVQDISVMQQYNKDACGNACGAMILRDGGVSATQQQIGSYTPLRRMDASSLADALTDLGKSGSWRGSGVMNDAQTIRALNARGSWIAMVDRHWVIVDGYDSAGRLMIRDPWGVKLGQGTGTRYLMESDAFLEYWTGFAVFRN